MDPTQEHLKFIQSIGIISESYKTILKWKKIFTQITFTLILPISITLIANMEISKRFFDNAKITSVDWLYYLLFKLISFIIIVVFGLLSTVAVSYTVALIYTGSDVCYRKAMKVVSKVWKRLILTFLCMFLFLFAYNLIAVVFFFFAYLICRFNIILFFVLFAIFITYVFGFLYLSIIWQLASVVSVLENYRGLKSMTKSMDLLKGKRRVALAISFFSYTFFIGIISMYTSVILYDAGALGFPWRPLIGILCGVLLLIAFLLFTVTQSILYLVCKSHHRETIDKISLSTYLGAYFAEAPQPVFKVAEDIQLGRPPAEAASGV